MNSIVSKMSNLNDIKEYFSEDNWNCMSHSQKTMFADSTVTMDALSKTNCVKEEPLELTEAANSEDERKDQIQKLYGSADDEKFEGLDLGDFVILCKEEAQDILNNDCDVKMNLQDEQHLINYDTSCPPEFCVEKNEYSESHKSLCSETHHRELIQSVTSVGQLGEGEELAIPENVDDAEKHDHDTHRSDVTKRNRGLFETENRQDAHHKRHLRADYSGGMSLARDVTNVHPTASIASGDHKDFKYNLKTNSEQYLRKRDHSKVAFECQTCNRSFTRKHNLQKHLLIHSGEKPFECKICNKSFTENGSLKRHLGLHTDEKPYECEICNKSFSTKDRLKRHLYVHTSKKRFECKICKKSFHENGDLKKHLRVHTGEKPFECKICNKSFTHNPSLKVHIRVHAGVKPFKCKICNKTFTYKGSLNSHLPLHTGEKPFECEICNKSFSTKRNLTRHIHVHTDKKPFECKICNKSYAQTSHLKRHLRLHTGEQPLECKLCKESFSTRHQFKRHLLVHTGEKRI